MEGVVGYQAVLIVCQGEVRGTHKRESSLSSVSGRHKPEPGNQPLSLSGEILRQNLEKITTITMAADLAQDNTTIFETHNTNDVTHQGQQAAPSQGAEGMSLE